jgi:uncharacterized protein
MPGGDPQPATPDPVEPIGVARPIGMARPVGECTAVTTDRLADDVQPLHPTSQPERIVSLDVLRGVAVLGILMLNIQSYAMPAPAYGNPHAFGDMTGINGWIWYVSRLLGSLKFLAIFGMLFGAGIVMQSDRCAACGRGAAGLHYRRMGWLLLFGLLHAHLIWFGDILYAYALCGMVVFPLRKLSASWQISLGVLTLLGSTTFSLWMGLGMADLAAVDTQSGMNEAVAAWEYQIQEELTTYRADWLTQQPLRMKTAWMFETLLFAMQIGWRSAGMMLIGMGLYKLGVFSARRSVRCYTGLVAVAVLIGVPIFAYGIRQNESAGWVRGSAYHVTKFYSYWANQLIALGWVGLVMLACKARALRAGTRLLAAAGRMALSCYLLESIIATLIFYGHGLGQFGRFERWQQFATVLAIWVFLLLFCKTWLGEYRYGPFEWLWRSLTYRKPQPMRLAGKIQAE